LLSFLWFALGLGALVVALALCALILRLIRTLGALEESLNMLDDAVREVLPEIRSTLGNVNDISAGVNVAVRGASLGAIKLTEAVDSGLGRLTRGVQATAHGVRVGIQSALASGREIPDGGDIDVE